MGIDKPKFMCYNKGTKTKGNDCMYIYDQRKPLTCNFSELREGDLFAWEEGDDLFYLMVIDDDDVAEDCGKAVVLGARESDTHLAGTIWTFKIDDEVQPLKGDLKVWAK